MALWPPMPHVSFLVISGEIHGVQGCSPPTEWCPPSTPSRRLPQSGRLCGGRVSPGAGPEAHALACAEAAARSLSAAPAPLSTQLHPVMREARPPPCHGAPRALPLMKDLFRSPLPPVHSGAD